MGHLHTTQFLFMYISNTKASIFYSKKIAKLLTGMPGDFLLLSPQNTTIITFYGKIHPFMYRESVIYININFGG